jgi:SAM-dependent methyltransferase
MSEVKYPGFDPQPLRNSNYRNNRGVSARFHIDDLASPAIDIEGTELAVLALRGDERIGDVGGGSGGLANRLCGPHDHLGLVTVIEPNPLGDQMMDLTSIEADELYKGFLGLPDTAENRKSKQWAADLYSTDPESFIKTYVDTVAATQKPRPAFKQGDANNIPLDDNSFDILFENGILYHVPQEGQEDQKGAMKEAKRVLTSEGTLVVATSGQEHKKERARLIEDLADELGVIPAVPFNRDFTHERASEFFTYFFNYVHRWRQPPSSFLLDKIDLIEGNDYKLNAYLDDIKSQRDQFFPIPDKVKFEYLVETFIRPKIIGVIEREHEFVDIIDRKIFLCSDYPLEQIPFDFELINGVAA